MRINIFLTHCVFIVSFVVASDACAQNWLPGYEFRKKITFDKTKIEGDFINSGNGRVDYDVTDFPVLVELQDDAFKNQPAPCDGILQDEKGRNVAFTLASAPTVKLNFQIDSYDPVLGKYSCWVRIPSLASSRTSTPATAIYFYYGGAVLHESNAQEGLGTWNADYTSVWHMSTENVEQLIGHNLTAESEVNGKIGKAIALNGQNQYLSSAGNTNNAFTFSAWIKWNGGTEPQVIADNDSVSTGKKMGWDLKINTDGKLAFTTYKSQALSYTVPSSSAIIPGTWNLVVIIYSVTGTTNSNLTVFINGASVGSIGGTGLRLSHPGGYMSFGRAKDGTQYFKGVLDEFRILNIAKPIYWLRNEFKNQTDPASFYAIAEQEYSPSWATFSGAVSTNWTSAGNWVGGVKPVSGGKLRIAAGKSTKISGSDLALSQLVLEAGASLSSGVNLQLNCNATIASGAVLNVDAGKKLLLAGGDMTISGAGTVNISDLGINAERISSQVVLEASVNVANSLKLVKGILNAKGKLTLLATKTNTASVLPVLDVAQAKVIGDVNVQAFIDGSFPEPSSGRGWRLLSSPVVSADLSSYGISALKECIFITGAGGAINGFDDSPKNGATIYTHDQDLPGTLSQKYVPIANMNATVPVGKGIYVYSRGSRLAANAYREQIEAQPFSNPLPYILTYKGRLYTGDLTIPVFNKNTGGDGDGFNLLGNPYASAIKWGALDKLNVGPFVWLFDPLNNAYQVSDDPETVIPAGAGFFVKVLAGFASGSVGFSEGAKIVK